MKRVLNRYGHNFTPLQCRWTLTALNPQAAPERLRQTLAVGVVATVPGEATTCLLKQGLIPDPFDGDNESSQQWIGDVDWRYSGHFIWHDDGHSRHDLVAYGLDTVADVMLNGSPVGNACDYYRTHRWDIAPLLVEGDNCIQIDFKSPVRESDRLERQRGYYPHTEHHAFNQLRKPSYQFGWDWGIDAANAGIWRPIGMDSWSDARLKGVRPLVDVDAQGTGILTTTVEIERAGTGRVMNPAEANEGQAPIEVTVAIKGQGCEVSASSLLDPGRTSATVVLRVPEVELWWPRGYGDQPLYDVHVELNRTDGLSEGRGKTDAWDGRVGFRTVRLDNAADEHGRPFQIYVNETPVHARGYNWVPVDVFPSRIGTESYLSRFDDLVQSNSNMVRVWGGGIYEADLFYDLADELGIMVWQDFMLACAAYPEDAQTKAQIEAEAEEQISRLCPHPSLVVWNGSNENYVAYAQWAGYKQALRDDSLQPNAYGYGERGWGDYYYSTLFPNLLSRLDPTRVYLPSSPMSFTPFTDANLDTDGTMHIWDVWNRKDYREYGDYKPRFADEFGYQAPPAWSTLTRVVHDEPADAFGPQMLTHQKASQGNYKLAKGMRSHLTEGVFDDVSRDKNGHRDWLIESDRWADLEDWHWACQLQQAQAVRYGVEHMRSLEPLNAGLLIWQLNDDWPVVSWAAVDYYGHRKPLWYASRDVFAPRFATIQPRVSDEALATLSWEGGPVKPDHLSLILLNDTCDSFDGRCEIERIAFNGRVLASQRESLCIEPLSRCSVRLDESVANFTDARQELIAVRFDDESSQGRCGFARVIYNPCEVIDQRLSPRPYEATAVAAPGGYELTITATSYVRDLFCMSDKVDPRSTVDSGMVSLLPGESRVWSISSDAVVTPAEFTAARVLRSANDLQSCAH